jgi:SAM-dependent methyltransferase
MLPAEPSAPRDRAGADGSFRCAPDGIWHPVVPVTHRDSEYDSRGFDLLVDLQSRHFWYAGRHRFLRHAVSRATGALAMDRAAASAVDLGGGTGGWVSYAHQHPELGFAEWALADSSLRALEIAGRLLPSDVRRYQIDLLNLHWHERWDVAFLLDVLEHIPEQIDALRQVREALVGGGLLFVTVPALAFFWSYNDVLGGHQRRYSLTDFVALAAQCGLQLLDARYFMFLLSPLYFLARLREPDLGSMSPEGIRGLIARTHRVPPAPLNRLLRWVGAVESPLGHWCPFPWGTSLLGVFRKA